MPIQSRGIITNRPFVLVVQQDLADLSRSSGSLHPVWAYAQVPMATATTPRTLSSLGSDASRRDSGSAPSR